MRTPQNTAPLPSALTFINLINASGVSVAALNAVISTNTNKCDRSVSGIKLVLFICETNLSLFHTHAHWAIPTWKPSTNNCIPQPETFPLLMTMTLHQETGARCALAQVLSVLPQSEFIYQWILHVNVGQCRDHTATVTMHVCMTGTVTLTLNNDLNEC